MNVMITARRCTVPAPVIRRAEARLRNLTRFEPRILGVEAIFELDHGRHTAEARITVAGGPLIVARGTGEGFGEALDQLIPRVRRRLQSRREKRRTQRMPQGTGLFAAAGR